MKKEKIEKGYEVVYDHKGFTLHAGNPIVFPSKELAEAYKENYDARPWVDKKLYIRPAHFGGGELKECREFEGKSVYNADWYFGTDALKIGSYVEQEIVDMLINCLPPACLRSDCTQLGEAADHKVDEDGMCRAVYGTFKKVAEDIWEYCGNCFRGENVPSGKPISIV